MSSFLKSGTKVKRDGTYICIDCEGMEMSYKVRMKKGEALPHCPKCDHDAKWQIE